ncbi:probable sugar phosphate/phosphate translocator At1g06470 [Selaginella moellendorffii]|uniref:probable sugar phosphate/phosphate translocator At1g06470 n=1 Tax=Selaginella moellendorffii TaxID=88036 RepID=UPI000D1CC35D|nr:probable sugar phosphate/phosphate translocator At1g06470 [Selaginella moellendorffii]|eukprot:XP_024535354.1 probable sugar phosphate/phosphate translocator At1g06470 [Selaginella moellendorffii]
MGIDNPLGESLKLQGFEELPLGAGCRMDRVLSFSNGIASACGAGARGEDHRDESSSNRSSSCDSTVDAAFTFASVDDFSQHELFQRRSSHYEAGAPDLVALKVDGFEGSDGASDCESTAKKTDFEKLLDEIRSSGDGSDAASLIRTVLQTLFYVLLWYNKLLLGKKYGKFPAPLLMNTIHFSMQAIVSSLLLRCCFPSMATTVSMSWKDYFVRVVPTGVATALDVDLTNASLVFIPVTFATMCKSATPVFLLLFAFIFKLETPSFKLFGIIFIISCGVLLTVAQETHFIFAGFVLVMLAALSSGFRWVVTQLLLQKEEYGLSNPLAAMSQFTPIMALITAIFSLILEPWHELAETSWFDSRSRVMESTIVMLLGGTLAFFMVIAEYLLIIKTSAVTMTVAGVVKEVVTVVAAIICFQDEFTLLKGIGFFVIVVGVALYNWFKYEAHIQKKDRQDQSGIEIGTVKYTILNGTQKSSDEEILDRV